MTIREWIFKKFFNKERRTLINAVKNREKHIREKKVLIKKMGETIYQKSIQIKDLKEMVHHLISEKKDPTE